jgi:hypothetical protein
MGHLGFGINLDPNPEGFEIEDFRFEMGEITVLVKENFHNSLVGKCSIKLVIEVVKNGGKNHH